MKAFSIKSIVSVANICLYTAITIIFVAIGLDKIGINFVTAIKISYIFIGLAIIIFCTYIFFRYKELKTTTFQLLPKHKFFMAIFIYGELLLLLISLLYIVLTNVLVFNVSQVRLFWYIFFPLVFIITIIISVLESIVRVEEKIFIAKQNFIASQKWEKEQKKAKQGQNSKTKKITSKETAIQKNNPFFETTESENN